MWVVLLVSSVHYYLAKMVWLQNEDAQMLVPVNLSSYIQQYPKLNHKIGNLPFLEFVNKNSELKENKFYFHVFITVILALHVLPKNFLPTRWGSHPGAWWDGCLYR